jgi:hypothetical protein
MLPSDRPNDICAGGIDDGPRFDRLKQSRDPVAMTTNDREQLLRTSLLCRNELGERELDRIFDRCPRG